MWKEPKQCCDMYIKKKPRVLGDCIYAKKTCFFSGKKRWKWQGLWRVAHLKVQLRWSAGACFWRKAFQVLMDKDIYFWYRVNECSTHKMEQYLIGKSLMTFYENCKRCVLEYNVLLMESCFMQMYLLKIAISIKFLLVLVVVYQMRFTRCDV